MTMNVTIAGSSLLYSRLPFNDACAKLSEIGFEYVDVGMLEDWAHFDPSTVVDDPKAAGEMVERVCAEHGLEPVAVNARVGGSTSTAYERVKALAAVADFLGVRSITLPAGVESPIEADLERVERLVDATASYDVTLAVETHYGTPTADPAGAERYLRHVPDLGLTLDPSHFAIESYSIDEYRHLFADTVHVHVRQAGTGWEEIQRPIDRGRIDFDRLIDELADGRYDGTITIEYIDSLDGVDPADAEHDAREAFEYVSAIVA